MNIDNDELRALLEKIQGNDPYDYLPKELQSQSAIDEKLWNEAFEKMMADRVEILKKAFAAQRQALRDEVLGAIGENELVLPTTGEKKIQSGAIFHRNQLRVELRTAISIIFEGKVNLQDGGKDG